MKRILAALFFIAILAGIGFLITNSNRVTPTQGKLRVVASLYPISFFANEIGGDYITVATITPIGAEPHDYEPTTRDIANIEQSNLLILNGQIEPWGPKIMEDLKNTKTTVVVAGEKLISRGDAHVWLDPVLAKQEAIKISEALIRADPTHASSYTTNMKKLGEKLDALDVAFKNGLAHCQQKNIITSHAAFGYIAARYNLLQLSIAGLSPDEEPSPQKLAEISQFIKEHNIQYIFFESLVSPRLSQTIARETGATTIIFNPLEGLTHEEVSNSADYFLLQKQNLDNLKIALSCI